MVLCILSLVWTAKEVMELVGENQSTFSDMVAELGLSAALGPGTEYTLLAPVNTVFTGRWAARLSVLLSVCLSVCPSVCLSVCLPVCLSFCLSACLSVCLPVCLHFSLNVCPVCLYVCQFLCRDVSLSFRLYS